MPGRQSHGAPKQAAKLRSKVKQKNKKRALNAYAIAEAQNPEELKKRRHRLGEIAEASRRPTKRARGDDDEDDDEEEGRGKRPKNAGSDVDGGSDSEGNEWRLGVVDPDDDSEIDSDEAMNESDEDNFNGYAFSGSSTNKQPPKKKRAAKEIDLNEDDSEEDDEFDDPDDLSDGLGEDAIDLATALDQYEESGDERADPGEAEKRQEQDDDSESNGDDSDDADSESGSAESDSESEDEDEDEEVQPEQLAALRRLVGKLPEMDEDKKIKGDRRSNGINEQSIPSNFGMKESSRLTFDDLATPSLKDPNIKKARKLLASESKDGKSQGAASRKLEVPLAKRQQDRLDRAAAYEKSKETLDRWTDTVKHNREADHLMFPLPDPDGAGIHENSRLQPTSTSKPFNELEATIQNILQESGMAAANGKDEEDKIREFEELEMNKLSLEEVQARRAELRRKRDIMFREEARAKRIKKIKSKSYRRVHRKELEKQEKKYREGLEEAGIEPSEDEQEAQDRRRAEERMGGRHKNSKWAKALKETGRAAWDEEARSGVTELARRDEELRKRVEGKVTREGGNDDSDSDPFSASEDDSDDDGANRGLLKQLDQVGAEDVDKSAPGYKLHSMKFMRNAEAARQKQNNETIEQIRRELAGEESVDEEEDDSREIGRRKYGPGSGNSSKPEKAQQPNRNQFEEPLGSGDEDDDVVIKTAPSPQDPKTSKGKSQFQLREKPLSKASSARTEASAAANPWATAGKAKGNDAEAVSEKRRSAMKNNDLLLDGAQIMASLATQRSPKKPKKATKGKKSTILDGVSDDDSDDGSDVQLPFAIRDQDLIKKAFAGADVDREFEEEKRQVIEDEDEKMVDTTLPGWGTWAGEGLSKKEKLRNKRARTLTKQEGVKAQDRKDAKLERVIINEKRVKKVRDA